MRGSTVTANAGDGIHNDFADLVVEDTTVTGNTAQVTAIGGTTEVRGATLSGPGRRTSPACRWTSRAG